MAKVTANVGFDAASNYEVVPVELDRDDVSEQYIPAVKREVPITDDEGNVALDPETGAPLTTTEIVTPARTESLEEAVRRVLVEDYLVVDALETSGVSSLRFVVQYSGEVELELESYELDGFEEADPEDITAEDIQGTFEDAIIEAIQDDVGYGGPQVEVVYFDAE